MSSWAASWLSLKMLASRDGAGVLEFFVEDAPVTHGDCERSAIASFVGGGL